MNAGIAIDHSCNSDCLTRLNDGAFHWSEQTINTIGSTSTQDKRLTFALPTVMDNLKDEIKMNILLVEYYD